MKHLILRFANTISVFLLSPLHKCRQSIATIFIATLLFIGLTSKVQAAYTVTAISVSGTQTGTLTYGTGAGVTYTVTLSETGFSGGTTTLTLNWTGGTAPSGVTFSPTGATTLTGNGQTITLTVTSAATTPAGSYSFTVTSSSGSKTSSPASTFIIGQAALTITASAQSKTYGSTVATGAGSTLFTSSGLKNSETIGSVTIAIANSGATSTAPVGTYTITPSAATGGTFLAANYSITYNTGTLTVNPEPLSITPPTIASEVYNGTTTTGAVTVGTLSGFIGSETVTATATGVYADKNVGTGKTATITYTLHNGTNGGLATNYSLANGTGSGNVTPMALTITAVTNSKTYNGTTSAAAIPSITSGSLQGTDVAGFLETYATQNVGTSITLTPSGVVADGNSGNNYTYTYVSVGTGTITTAPLTITGITASNKPYDGTTTATLSGTAAYSGLQNGETYTVTGTPVANFASPAVGTGIAVTVTGYTAPTSNYSLSQPTGLTANITALVVQLSGTRVYDGTNLAPASDLTISNNVDGGNLTLSGTGLLASANAGSEAISVQATPSRVQSGTGNTGTNTATSFTVTMGATPGNGNTLVAVISTRNTAANTVSSISETGATWTRAAQATNTNGTTTEIWYASNISGAGTTITINQSNVRSAAAVMEYSGVLTASALDVTANTTGNSTTASTGTTATTAQANEVVVAGLGIVNSAYSISSITNSFTTVADVATTNGTTSNNAEVYALEKIVTAAGTETTGGTVSTSSQWSGAIATFKATLSSGTTLALGGSAAGNYTLSGLNSSMTITPLALSITAPTIASKVYDGTTTSGTVTVGTLSGFIGTQTVTATATGTYSDPNVGTGKTATVTYTLANGTNGGLAINYSLANGTGTGNITAAPLTITGITANNKAYDGTTAATLSGTAALNGVFAVDVSNVTLGGTPVATFASTGVGTGIGVSVTGYTISGSASGNYSLSQPTGLTANITALVVQLSGTRVYDGTNLAPASDLTISNNVDGGNLTLAGTGLLASANAGSEAISVQATPSRVQSGTGNTGTNTATSFTVTMSATPGNGNTLVAVISTRNTAANTVSSITETGATWTRAAQATNTNGTTTEIWYASNVSSAGTTITINQSNVRSAAAVMEYSGILTASALDVTANTTGNSTTASTGTTATTAQANEVVVAGLGIVNSAYSISSITNSFTTVADVATTNGTTSNNAEVYALEKIVTAAGTETTGGTVSTSSQWSGAIATFKATLSSGTTLALGGSAAGNYTLSGLNSSMTITPLALSITAPTIASKVYNGTTTAGAVTVGTLSGFVGTQTVTATAVAAPYSSANVGSYPGDVVTYTLNNGTNGGLAINYSLAAGTATGTITAASLTITASAQSKAYGGTASTTGVLGTTFTISGLQSSDAVSGSTLGYSGSPAGNLATAAVGSYTITPSAAVFSSGSASNYSITYSTGTLTVNAAPLTVTASAQSKTYGGTVSTTGVLSTTFTVSGLQNSDAVSGATLGYSGNPAGNLATAAVGSYTITPSATTFSSGSASNYSITYSTGTLTVNTAALTVTASAQSKTYGGTAPTTGTLNANFTVSGLQNSDAVNGTTLGYSGSPAGNLATAAVGSYTITPSAATFSTGSASNYTITYSAGTLTINTATLTITGAATKTYGQTLTGSSGSTNFISSGLQNGETIGSVTIAYSGTGPTAAAAVGTYSVSATPSAATGGTFTASNYTITYAAGNIVVNAAPLTVTASAQSKTYGGTVSTTGVLNTTFTVSGLLNSDAVNGATLGYSGSPAGNLATAAAGSYTITPSAATFSSGSSSNYTITYSTGTLTVNAAALTVTASAQSKTYGGTASTTGVLNTTYTVSGLQNSDAVNGATLGYSGSPAGNLATAAVGSYTITPAAATFSSGSASNYSITYSTATLTVNVASLTVTASAQSKTYGGTASTTGTLNTTFTVTGLENSDAVNGATLGYSGSPAGNLASAAVGSYTITPSAATFSSGSASNYTITYSTGTLTVNTAALTVKASAQSKTYGGTVSTTGVLNTTFTVTGLQNSDSVNGATLGYSGSPAGNLATAAAGSYTITPSAATFSSGSASNYTITFSTGTLTVNAAPLTVTASAQSKTYGGTSPTAGTLGTNFTVSGLQNSDAVSGATLGYSGNPAGNLATAAVGSYTITPSATTFSSGSASNYSITYSTGTLTVNTAALTVTASAQSKTYGGTAPTTGTLNANFTVSGLQNSDAVNGTTLGYSGSPAGNLATAAVGSYTITPSAATFSTGSASNYTITYSAGTLTINTATLTITGAATKTYGQTLTGSSGSTNFISSGLQNGETIGSVTIAYSGTGPTAAAAVGTYSVSATPSAATGGTFTASNYTITYAAGNIVVNAAPLTVTASAQSKTYGGTVSTTGVLNTTFTVSGLLNSDVVSGATLGYSGSPAGNLATAAAGSYTITPSATTFSSGSASNYTITYSTGTLTVNAAALTVTASAQSKTYGGAAPTTGTLNTTFTVSGLQNSDAVNGATLGYSGSPAGNLATAAVGSYTITPSAATFSSGSASNYSITYSTGTLIVNTAPLTVKASAQSKTYGGTASTTGTLNTTFTVSGLQNSDAVNGATLGYSGSPAGNLATAAVGSYTITPSAATFSSGSASNYTITYSTGTLTVNTAALTVTGAATKTYGQTLTSGSGSTMFTSGGLQNGETIGSVTMTYSGTGPTATAAVGTYTVSATPSAATGGTFTTSNYSITYAAGSIIVTAAPITITANNVNKTYGTALSTPITGSTAYTITSGSIQNGQTIGSITITYTSGYTATSAVGSYTGAVVPSAATGGTFTASNYSITYSAGTLTVNPGPLAKLLILLPGETATPGTSPGYSGSPTAQTSGTAFNVTVEGVDAYWNLVPTASDNIAITSTDVNATMPANSALSSGTQTFSVTLITKGTATLTATDATNGSITANVSPSVTVNAGALNKLQTLLPGETAAPGTLTGKTGSPDQQVTGTAFNLIVNGVDANWNVTAATDNIHLVSSNGNTMPANAALASGTETFAITMTTPGTPTITASDVTNTTITSNTSAAVTVIPAQADSDYFRSVATGNWNATTTWQRSADNVNWYSVIAPPTASTSNLITIQSGTTVTVTASVIVDNVVVNSGGQVTINDGDTLTVNNGGGTDLDVFGTVEEIGTGNVGAVINLQSGASVVFESTGLYIHNFSSTSTQGSIPTATWNTGSTCEVIGFTSNTLVHIANLTQSFSNFTWNCPNQTVAYGMSGLLTTVLGNFTMQNSGNQIVYALGADHGSSAYTLTVGNMIFSGGILDFVDNTGNSGTYTLNIGGSYSQTSGTFQSDYSTTVNFTGTGTFSQSGGTLTSDNMNFNVNNGASLTLNTNIPVNTSFTVSSGGTFYCGTYAVTGGGSFTNSSGGTLGIGSTNGITSSGASGNVQVTGTRSFNTAGNYIYDGSSAQVTGNGLPATVNNLTIINSSGVTLTNAVTVSNLLTLTSGIVNTNSKLFALASAGSVSRTSGYVYGTFTKYIAAGTGSKNFEIGDASNYTPVLLSFSGTATNGTGNLAVSTTPGLQPQIGTSDINSARCVNRYWTVTNTGVTFGSAAATFNFINPGDILGNANTANFIISKYASSAWTFPTVGTLTTTSSQATGLNATFGQFAIGDTCVPTTINTPVITNVNCNGGSTGAISITTSGGSAPLTYLWSNGATTQNLSNIPAATYSVVVTANGGCASSATNLVVTQPTALLPNASEGSSVSCNGGNNGSVTAAPGGGVSPYTLVWSTGATTSTVNNLAAGTYTVTVTDSHSCTAIATATVTQPAVLAANASQTPVNCYGQSNGSVQSAPTGGTSPYSYLWSPGGATTSSITNLSYTGTTYTVTVTDNNGCTASGTATVTQPAAPLAANVSDVTEVSCYGASNGSVKSVPTGGTTPYAYLWSTGATTSTVSNLSAGTYSVTVTDHNSCTATGTVTVTQPAAPLAANASDVSEVSCHGGNNGSVTSTPTGGTSPYTYLWNTGATTSTISNLTAATYTVTVKDFNSCTSVATVTVTQPAALAANASDVTEVSCNGGANGSVTSTPTGGTSPYAYLWNTGATTSTITGLSATTYTVTVTDNNACTATGTVTVTQPAVLAANASDVTEVSCYAGTNGSVKSVPTGGTSPYTYLWSTGATTSSVSGLSAATYTVTVTDHNSCTATGTVTVTQPSAPLAADASDLTEVSCYGGNNGSITSVPTGGTSPYTYLWSTGATTSTVTSRTAGTYTVTVTDHNSCTATGTVTVTQPSAALAANASDVTEVSCHGGSNGSVTSNPTGGTNPYTYLWNTGATTSTISNLTAATYTVTVTDHNTCTATATATVTQPAVLTPNASDVTEVSCNGGSDGSVTSTPSGGTSLYAYLWNTGATTSTISGLSAATYTVTVTDNNSCTATGTVTVTQPAVLAANASDVTEVSCYGGTNGSVKSAPTGGTSPYAYLWSTGATTSTISGLAAGTYSVTVTDHNSCTATGTVTVTQPAFVPVPTVADVDNCASSTLTASNYTGTLSWSTGATTSAITVTTAGTYSVLQTVSGCTGPAGTGTAIPITPCNLSYTSPDIYTAGIAITPLSPTVTGAVASYSVNPSLPAGLNLNTSTGAISGTPTTTTATATYTVTATNSVGSTTTFGIIITVNPGALSTFLVQQAGGGNIPTQTAGTAFTIQITAQDANGNTVTSFNSTVALTVTAAYGSITPATTSSFVNGVLTSQAVTVTQATSQAISATNGAATGASNTFNVNAGAFVQLQLLVAGQTAAPGSATGVTGSPSAVTSGVAFNATVNGVDANWNVVTGATDNINISSGDLSATLPPNAALVSGTDIYSITLVTLGAQTITATDVTNSGIAAANVSLTVNPAYIITTAVGGAWNQDSTWVGGIVPLPTDDAIIAAGATATVTTNATVNSVTFNNTSANAGTLTVNAGQTLTVNTGITAQNGTTLNTSVVIAGAGVVNCASLSLGGITPTAGGLTSSLTSTIANLSIAGNVNITGYDGGSSAQDEPTFALQSGTATIGGTISIAEAGSPGGAAGAVTFTMVTGAQSGTLYLSGSTPFSVANSYTINLDGSSSTVNYSGSVQPVYATAYHDLILSGSGNKSMFAGTSVGDVLFIQDSLAQANISNGLNISVVDRLWLGDSAYVAGTYGSTNSPATYTNNTFFTPTTGYITVASSGLPASFTGLSANDSICVGTSSVTLSGTISGAGPVYPAIGEKVYVTINGSTQNTIIADSTGDFSINFPTGNIPASGSSYTIIYLYTGNDTLNPNTNTSTTLLVNAIPSVMAGNNGPVCTGAMLSLNASAIAGAIYSWTGPGNYNSTSQSPTVSDSATSAMAATYSVTATVNGCTSPVATTTVTVNALPVPNASEVSPVSCFNGTNGSVTVAATSGASPYSYSWSDPNAQTTASATGLAAGTYTVTVTYNNGCSTTGVTTVTQPAVLAANASVLSAVSCYKGTNGSVTAAPTGGTSPYNYSWSDPNSQTTASATGLAAASYTVTVTDNNGCTATGTSTVIQPALLTANASALTAASCYNFSNGSVTAAPAGGTSPFSYSWNDPNSQATDTATGLAAGTYTVTVTDNNGCTATSAATVIQPAIVAVNASAVSAASCYNFSNGSVTAAPTGGTSPYSYSWNDPNSQITDTATGLAAGTYTVTVTDNNGCTSTGFATVTQPAVLATNASALSAASCYNFSNGSVTASPTGGSSPYSYSWNDPNSQATDTATGLAAGTYTVTVIDNNGCTSSGTATVTQPTALAANASALSAATCYNYSNGSVTASPTGGTSPYSYSWNDPNTQTTDTATGLPAGSYTVTVTDNNGCTATDMASVATQPPAVTAPTVIDADNCASSTLTASNFTGTLLWSTLETTSSITVTTAGTYSVTQTINGCTGAAGTGTAAPLSLPSPSFTAQPGDNSCMNEPDIYTTQSGQSNYVWTVAGILNTDYLITSGGIDTSSNSATIQWLTSGSKTVSINYTSSNGCTARVPASTTTSVNSCIVTFTVKFYLQGYYMGNGLMSPLMNLIGLSANGTDADSATIELHSAANPAVVAYSFQSILQSNGNLVSTFPGAVSGNSYYIVIRHRNSLATWSANPVAFTTGGSYDFTTGAGQAYGSGGMTNLGGGVFGIYSGDVNQDGTIDGSDNAGIQSVLSSFLLGVYNVNDITGDGTVDANDARLMRNNAALGIAVQHP